MAPTRIYVKSLLPLLQSGRVKGGAHITGGGLIENPPRAIAEGLAAEFDWNAWPLPPVFDWLAAAGRTGAPVWPAGWPTTAGRAGKPASTRFASRHDI